MYPKEIKIVEDMTLVCCTLRWDDRWEFDFPSILLSPVVRCFESGRQHDSIVEDVLIDAVTSKDGILRGDDFEKVWGWRGYKLPVLRRRFNEAMRGKKFPVAGYHAEREIVKIIRLQNSLTWTSERDAIK